MIHKSNAPFSTQYQSPLGPLLLESDGENIVGLWIKWQKSAETAADKMPAKDDLPVFAATRSWLDRYFADKKPEICELPLAPFGGEFRQTVWKILCEIPYGEVTSYGEIAKKIAAMRGIDKMAAQAVGGAVGHNPISIIIPCHRVVGTDGSLTGYGGGMDKKVWLLNHEGLEMSSTIHNFY